MYVHLWFFGSPTNDKNEDVTIFTNQVKCVVTFIKLITSAEGTDNKLSLELYLTFKANQIITQLNQNIHFRLL